MSKKTALIIGGGPAGLTAAYELLEQTNVHPIVVESDTQVGGISKTIHYKGNKIDIGGHRFFSKSDRVMAWWQRMIPPTGDPEKTDRVFLTRGRLSRIYFLRKFFSYPISLSLTTMRYLGLWRLIMIGISYTKAILFPIKPEKSLEDFFINRFGKTLYRIFFKDYTEKVWGEPCHTIDASWGAQRIKGLSIRKAIAHALKQIVKKDQSVEQKKTETSLIERFLYPKHGPGQLWEVTAEKISERGGIIHMQTTATQLHWSDNRVTAVTIHHQTTNQTETIPVDYVISTMPVKCLIQAMQPTPPAAVVAVANGLKYRDFITVGLLLKKLNVQTNNRIDTQLPDTWIYIQERDVKIGRLQIFNNWSPYLVKDPDTVWLGLEYFCYEGDELWQLSNAELIELGKAELAKINLINPDDVLDAVAIKVPKTYPAYFGTYSQFDTIRTFTDGIDNLFLIGRNGTHRYNNQDHSMLTAMTAVEAIKTGSTDKQAIWSVNTEQDYHETKATAAQT